jgi:hypothetical protein
LESEASGKDVVHGQEGMDIHRRPEEEIWCNKWLWTLASFVNFVGPISYFSFGRKR